MIKAVAIEGFEKYSVNEEGKVFNKWGKVIKPHMGESGCVNVTLYNNHKVKHISVAKLVLSTFKPELNIGRRQIFHIDGDKLNNHTDNLRVGIGNVKGSVHSKTLPIIVYNMNTEKTTRFESISEFGRYLGKVDKSRSATQHLRSLNHYIKYRQRFFIYNEYRVSIDGVELNESELSFNANDYYTREEICNKYNLSNYQFDCITKRCEIKTYHQKSVLLYSKEDVDTLMKEEIFLIRGIIYYKSDYNIDSELSDLSSRGYGKEVKVTNLITNKTYIFLSLTLAAKYINRVLRGNSDKIMLQTLSKQLSRGKNYYKFFDIEVLGNITSKSDVKLKDLILIQPLYDIPNKCQKRIDTALVKYRDKILSVNNIEYKDMYSLNEVSELLGIPYGLTRLLVDTGYMIGYKKFEKSKYIYISHASIKDFIRFVESSGGSE